MQSLLVLFPLLFLGESVKLPPNFIKCDRKDPDWKKCVFKAGVDALPQLIKPFDDLNIPNLNPLFIPEITINAGSRTVQFTQNFKNCELYGLTNVDAKKFEFDFDEKNIDLEGTFPEIKVFGRYKIDGKLLILPIVGEGNGTTILKNLKVKAKLRFEEFKKKGKTHMKVVSGDLKMVPGHMTFKIDNLFNGDKTLGDNINKVLNENWQDVYKDVEKEYTELVLKIFTSLINGFCSKVSIEEAFD